MILEEVNILTSSYQNTSFKMESEILVKLETTSAVTKSLGLTNQPVSNITSTNATTSYGFHKINMMPEAHLVLHLPIIEYNKRGGCRHSSSSNLFINLTRNLPMTKFLFYPAMLATLALHSFVWVDLR